MDLNIYIPPDWSKYKDKLGQVRDVKTDGQFVPQIGDHRDENQIEEELERYACYHWLQQKKTERKRTSFQLARRSSSSCSITSVPNLQVDIVHFGGNLKVNTAPRLISSSTERIDGRLVVGTNALPSRQCHDGRSFQAPPHGPTSGFHVMSSVGGLRLGDNWWIVHTYHVDCLSVAKRGVLKGSGLRTS